MKFDILKFFNVQRRIFGVCPHSSELFRLSDCKIFLRGRPKADWMDRLDHDNETLDAAEERLEKRRSQLQEAAREVGRRKAARQVSRIDPVFAPRRLNPDDAKVLFHPIDFVVFDGMKKGSSLRRIVLLDRATKTIEQKRLQKSIEKVVEKEHYEWMTLRVKEDGTINEE